MMEVGNGGVPETGQRSHFAMWAVMTGPLIDDAVVKGMTSSCAGAATVISDSGEAIRRQQNRDSDLHVDVFDYLFDTS